MPEQVADICHEAHDSGILGHAGSYWMAQREGGIGPVTYDCVAHIVISGKLTHRWTP